ncbi:MAG: hypothetical protein IPI95_12040 [Flavobacteriales bacterium]|nr:hypothetical protein [Flavobacteriales bacterium]
MAGILLTCGYVAAFLFVIRRWRFFEAPGLPKRTICALFLLKVAVGTALWWIYTYHYPDRSTADIYRFFDDGNVLFSALPDHPGDYFRMLFGIGNDNAHFNEHYYAVMNNWHRKYDTGYYNDAHTMIRYSALVRLFSFGVYHVHTVFACFLSLVGLVALYKTFIGFVPEMNRALMAGLFLWPSMLFWGSAPIKEALLFLGLGLFLMGTFKLIVGPLSWKYIGLLVFGLLVQLVLKSYVLACMVPGLAALWWCRRTGGRHPILKFAATHTMAALLVLGLPIVAGRARPAQRLGKHGDGRSPARGGPPGKAMGTHRPAVASVLRFLLSLFGPFDRLDHPRGGRPGTLPGATAPLLHHCAPVYKNKEVSILWYAMPIS